MLWRSKQRCRTHPPLLVLLPCNDDHLSFDKCKFVVVVGLAVVDRLHPPGFILPLDTQEAKRFQFESAVSMDEYVKDIRRIPNICREMQI